MPEEPIASHSRSSSSNILDDDALEPVLEKVSGGSLSSSEDAIDASEFWRSIGTESSGFEVVCRGSTDTDRVLVFAFTASNDFRRVVLLVGVGERDIIPLLVLFLDSDRLFLLVAVLL